MSLIIKEIRGTKVPTGRIGAVPGTSVPEWPDAWWEIANPRF